MSELKEIGIRWEENGELHFSHVYLKSEADKVIAELKEKRDTAEKLLNKSLDCVSNGKNRIISLARKNNHSNYKRCLAMAAVCNDNADWWNYEQQNRLDEQNGNAESLRFKEAHSRFCFFVRWRHRWLEIAEKFKEAKSEW